MFLTKPIYPFHLGRQCRKCLVTPVKVTDDRESFLFWQEQQLFTAGLFTGLIVMSQLLLLVMETVLEGYFGIVIGVVGPLVMIFLSFLQMPLMPLRFAIGSTFASDQQLLGAIGYQLGLIIGLVLIQIFYMPGRWGRYAANHT